MGGIGKTQICLKFTEDMSETFSRVFWIDASSSEAITLSLKGLATNLQLPLSGADRPVGSVLQTIALLQEEWLLVFDNADGAPEVLENYIPSGSRGNILITTRNPSLRRVVTAEDSLEISAMEEDDAVTLLLKASCLDPQIRGLRYLAKGIVSELCYLPLAVHQAGASIESGLCHIDKYLEQFTHYRKELMSDSSFMGASKYEQTVYGTWEMSYRELESRAYGHYDSAQAAQTAILILQTCAFYHYDNLTENIFCNAAHEIRTRDGEKESSLGLPSAVSLAVNYRLLALDQKDQWDALYFRRGIQMLSSFSLIKRGDALSSDKFSIHPLVHNWSRDRMLQQQQQEFCSNGRNILTCGISRQVRTQDYLFRRVLIPHIKANLDFSSQLQLKRSYQDDEFTKFALVFSEHGDWKKAEEFNVHIVNYRTQVLGAEHQLTLISKGNLACTYWNQGRFDEAQVLELDVMNKMKTVFGPEHPYTLFSMGNLASTYRLQGHWSEAEALEVEVLRRLVFICGNQHPDTLVSMGNLAATYRNQGRWREAESMELYVMVTRKELLGEDHPDTLISMGNLASTYWNQRRLAEAEKLELIVMEKMKLIFGAEHPNTLTSMGNLASIYQNLGHWEAAEGLLLQVTSMRKMVLGADHPDMLTSLANLALVYWNQKRLEEAEKLEVEVMFARKRILGPEHPDTLTSIGNLASTFHSKGYWKKAEELQLQVLDARKKVLGDKHPDTLVSLGNLASTYHRYGHWKQAETLQSQVVETRKEVLGLEHPSTLTSMGNLASIYKSQQRLKKAEDLQIQVLNARTRLLGTEHPDTQTSRGNLASMYLLQGRQKEAGLMNVQVAQLNVPQRRHA
ncbi:hypothetical protein B0H34DRAFT_188332 [Crassisporium funariophilum]|nr:hypothetical protein B0H34DRAFT_188332 [Crassisporium funariophilum]